MAMTMRFCIGRISRRKTLTIARPRTRSRRDLDAADYFPRPLPKSDYQHPRFVFVKPCSYTALSFDQMFKDLAARALVAKRS